MYVKRFGVQDVEFVAVHVGNSWRAAVPTLQTGGACWEASAAAVAWDFL